MLLYEPFHQIASMHMGCLPCRYVEAILIFWGGESLSFNVILMTAMKISIRTNVDQSKSGGRNTMEHVQAPETRQACSLGVPLEVSLGSILDGLQACLQVGLHTAKRCHWSFVGIGNTSEGLQMSGPLHPVSPPGLEALWQMRTCRGYFVMRCDVV